MDKCTLWSEFILSTIYLMQSMKAVKTSAFPLTLRQTVWQSFIMDSLVVCKVRSLWPLSWQLFYVSCHLSCHCGLWLVDTQDLTQTDPVTHGRSRHIIFLCNLKKKNSNINWSEFCLGKGYQKQESLLNFQSHTLNLMYLWKKIVWFHEMSKEHIDWMPDFACGHQFCCWP